MRWWIVSPTIWNVQIHCNSCWWPTSWSTSQEGIQPSRCSISASIWEASLVANQGPLFITKGSQQIIFTDLEPIPILVRTAMQQQMRVLITLRPALGGFIKSPNGNGLWFSEKFCPADFKAFDVDMNPLAQTDIVAWLSKCFPACRFLIRIRSLSENTGAESDSDGIFPWKITTVIHSYIYRSGRVSYQWPAAEAVSRWKKNRTHHAISRFLIESVSHWVTYGISHPVSRYMHPMQILLGDSLQESTCRKKSLQFWGIWSRMFSSLIVWVGWKWQWGVNSTSKLFSKLKKNNPYSELSCPCVFLVLSFCIYFKFTHSISI